MIKMAYGEKGDLSYSKEKRLIIAASLIVAEIERRGLPMRDEYDFSEENVIHQGPVVKDGEITESFKEAVADRKLQKVEELKLHSVSVIDDPESKFWPLYIPRVPEKPKVDTPPGFEYLEETESEEEKKQ